MLGKVIGGRYRIEREIGSSWANEVYSGRDEETGRQVAVKVAKEGVRTRDISSITIFRQQMRHMAGLRNAYIVNVYDVVDEGDFPVVVSEYVEGEDLGSTKQLNK